MNSRLLPRARCLAAVVVCLTGTMARPLLGQSEPRFDWTVGIGGAEVGGRAKQDHGGLFARLGADVWVARDAGVDLQAALFGAPNSAGCVDFSPQCNDWSANGVLSLTLGAVMRFPVAGSVARPLRLDAGVGVASVDPNIPGPSPEATSLRVGAELDFLTINAVSLALDVHAMAIPNVHGTTLWVVPLTLGLRF